MTATTRVFLVDDHPLVRESLASLIQRQPDLSVCGEADHPAAALTGMCRVIQRTNAWIPAEGSEVAEANTVG